MKSFSHFALRVRTGRKQILNSSTSASCQALVRSFTTPSPKAGKHASAVSGDSLLIAGALTVASGGVLYFAMRQLDAIEEAKAVVGPEPKSPETSTFRYKTSSRGLVEYMVSYPGDNIYNLKWSGNRWKPPLFDASKHKTPPYVTAKPEITCKSLAGDERMGQLKFIILATDGLWDHITSDEAVGLVSTHLTQPKHAPAERKKVQDSLIPQRKDSAAKYPGGREKGEELKGSWVYQDKNAATHLIRNAFEACKFMPDAGKQVICAKPPIARWIRDDVTCSVIFFGDAAGEILPSSKDRTASTEV